MKNRQLLLAFSISTVVSLLSSNCAWAQKKGARPITIDTVAIVKAYKKKILKCRLDRTCRPKSTKDVKYPVNYSTPITNTELAGFTDIHGGPLSGTITDSFVLFDGATLAAFIDVTQDLADVHFTFARDTVNHNLTLIITGSDKNGNMLHYPMQQQGGGGVVNGYFQHCMPCPKCDK